MVILFCFFYHAPTPATVLSSHNRPVAANFFPGQKTANHSSGGDGQLAEAFGCNVTVVRDSRDECNDLSL
jgi:hypothetical protein